MSYQKVLGSNFNTPEQLKKYKEYNFTSTQTYVFWEKIEPEQGKFDFSEYDAEVQRVKEAGLKWVPFILVGPRYAAPDWRLNSKEFQPLVCLEHGKECPIESIWNPELKTHITRVLQALKDHYEPMDVIESVQPGICGDYGESIYPVHGNWPGAYHGHMGYWCGDPFAVADFQKYLKNKYKTIENVNKAHKEFYSDFSEIQPKLQHQCNRVAFFDMVIWYKQSMTDFTEFWMSECKRIFGKDMPAYICTGGCEQPLLGADFAAQARVCAELDCGIRLTNEANKFYHNFAITVHAWSACNYYGSYFGLEPVGPITSRGYRERLFGTMAYGNGQFHTYTPFDENINMRYEDKDWDFFNENMKPFKPGKTIGIFYPMHQSIFTGEVPESINAAVKMLRHNFPVSVICETMILDGALDNLDTLLIMDAEWADRPVIDKIVSWAKTRGKQLVSNCILKDINLKAVPEFNALFGINENSELCHGHSAHRFIKTEGYDYLNKIDCMDACDCYKDLDTDVEVIAYAKGTKGQGGDYCADLVPDVYSIFKKKINNCDCIMYTGYCDLIDDPESLFHSNQAFAALLKDVAKKDGVPYFELKEGEVAKAEFFGKTLVLTEKEIKIE